MGIPVAVLEGGAPEGRLWILGGYPSQLYAEYMAGTVRVEGEVRSQSVLIPAPAAEALAAPQAYEAAGVVVALLAEGRYLKVRHGEIPGYMDAMTMPFAIEDTALVRGLVPGDRIHFRFTTGPGGAVVRAVEPVEAP